MPPSAEPVERNMLIASSVLSGFMVLEYAWNMHFEMQVIRKRFWKNTEIKIFVISRYAGLFGQVFNVWFATRMRSALATDHALPCKEWYAYQAVITQILTMSGETFLMTRVYGMYKNDKYIYLILSVFAGTQCAAMAISARMVVPGIGSSPTCTVVQPHVGQIYVGASTAVVHLCLLAMMMWRYLQGNWPEHLRSYLQVMNRDSTFLVIWVAGVYLVVAIFPTGIVASQTVKTVLFPVLVATFWFFAGRLVLNKQRFLHDRQNAHEFTIVDLDNLYPSVDFDGRSTEVSESEMVPPEVKSIAIDTQLGAGTGDVADECPSDEALSHRTVSTALRMGMNNSSEESGSRIAL